MSERGVPLRPEQALLARDLAASAFRMEHPVTRRVIEAIPGDKIDFTPDPVVKSAIDLAWHIVGAEHRFVNAVNSGAFDFTNTGRPTTLHSPADIARWYAEMFEQDMAGLQNLAGEQLLKPLDFRGLFRRPARQVRRGPDPTGQDQVEQNGREPSPVGRPDFKSGRGREPVLGGFDSLSLPPVSRGRR